MGSGGEGAKKRKEGEEKCRHAENMRARARTQHLGES